MNKFISNHHTAFYHCQDLCCGNDTLKIGRISTKNHCKSLIILENDRQKDRGFITANLNLGIRR